MTPPSTQGLVEALERRSKIIRFVLITLAISAALALLYAGAIVAEIGHDAWLCCRTMAGGPI